MPFTKLSEEVPPSICLYDYHMLTIGASKHCTASPLLRVLGNLDSDFVFDMVLLIKTYGANHAVM